MAAQPGLCRNWSESPKTGFLESRLKCVTKKVITFSAEGDSDQPVNCPGMMDVLAKKTKETATK